MDKEFNILKLIVENGEIQTKQELRKLRDEGKYGVILHGNCNINVIYEFLQCCDAFRRHYFIMKIPRICCIIPEETELLTNCSFIWEYCDILLTQNIKETNRFDRRLSYQHLTQLLHEHNKNAEVLIIPTLYFDAYYITKNLKQKIIPIDRPAGILYPYNELVLDKLAENYDSDDIVKIVEDENLFSERFVNWCLDTRMEQLYVREKDWDIKIMNYISDNYRKVLLFWSINHPTNELFREVSTRIIQRLCGNGVVYDREIKRKLELPRQLIYPLVARWLRLEFTPPLYKDWEDMIKTYTFEEYVRRYLKKCWNK